MEKTEAQTFRQEYRELDAASMALFRTIIDLTLILLKQQSPTESKKGAAS
jgi:hypothetical protein